MTFAFAVLAGLALATVGTPGASATPTEWRPFHDTFDDVIEDFCDVPGLTVELEGVSEGRDRFVPRGADGLLHLQVQAQDTEAYTNRANGKSTTWVVERHGQELHVTDNGDGTLTYVVNGAGNGVLYAEDGTKLARQAGLFRYQIVYDYAGTLTDRSDDIKIGRPVILLQTGRQDDLCAAMVPALS
ncbi:hypothetical protein E0H73_28075 [Kribbella pittospori]|uniref:Allene oxide cyclase barrel-like domain-containing protein n=1 Tax=Kribbella pittospori TaxID=722689 RepID=A0A4R0KCZ5_9ACTN|nr:hypothetical protein [Kribbella pittospori]TCC58181.1 hypothetical protein E0H73_28075 [Kribbella pittospori]